jgi:hypothetical protein
MKSLRPGNPGRRDPDSLLPRMTDERRQHSTLRVQEDWGEPRQTNYAGVHSDSPRSLSSNPSPEGIDEQHMENRRLLMSILFLKPFAIVLASQAAKW